MFKKLYRNTGNAIEVVEPEFDITPGSSRTVTFPHPGWYAVDIKTTAPTMPDGSLSPAKCIVDVNGVEKLKLRGSWPFTRHYFFCDAGINRFGFTNDGGMQEIRVRSQWSVAFERLDYVLAIEGFVPPKPLDELVTIPILGGYTRYQSLSKRGTSVEFTVVIKGQDSYYEFMNGLNSVHLLRSDEGIYGGVIIPNEVQTTKKGGDLFLIRCVLHSPSQAGVGAIR